MIDPTMSSGLLRPDTTSVDPVLMARRAEHEKLVGADYWACLEQVAARLGLEVQQRKNGRALLTDPDGKDIQPWRENYPYPELLRRKPYESGKQALQIELLKLQQSVKASGQRLLIVFEGRDAAGKGGTIRRFAENLNPRGTRVVALDKPTAHEQASNYLGRFLPHVPASGEIVLLDRSWYNRAGVEHVLGFCQPEEYEQFLRDVPEFERMLTSDGIDLIKLWFSVTRTEQLRRFVDRQLDPVKRWKLSPVDLASLNKWDEYARAEDVMFRRTELPYAPWKVVKSNDKRRTRLEAMRYVLSLFDYLGKRDEVAGPPDPLIVGSPELVTLPPYRTDRTVAFLSGHANAPGGDQPRAGHRQDDYRNVRELRDSRSSAPPASASTARSRQHMQRRHPDRDQ
jgi:polyphosphate kinase 2